MKYQVKVDKTDTIFKNLNLYHKPINAKWILKDNHKVKDMLWSKSNNNWEDDWYSKEW